MPEANIVFGGSGSNRTVTVTPALDQFGSATITVSVSDRTNNAATSFVLLVNPVNDAPTLDLIGDLMIPQDAGLQTVALSGISPGPANELQQLTINAVSSNPGLISNPTVTYISPGSTGSLAFTPVPGASGFAIITVTVQDDGGTLNGGHDTATQIFAVTVFTPPVVHIALAGSNVIIRFETLRGVTYILEEKDPVTDSTWTTLRRVAGDGSEAIVTDSTSGVSTRFYRIRLE